MNRSTTKTTPRKPRLAVCCGSSGRPASWAMLSDVDLEGRLHERRSAAGPSGAARSSRARRGRRSRPGTSGGAPGPVGRRSGRRRRAHRVAARSTSRTASSSPSRERPIGRRRIRVDLDQVRLAARARAGIRRRHVEQAVGDRRRTGGPGSSSLETTAIRVTVPRSNVADPDRRERDEQGEPDQHDRRRHVERAVDAVAVLAPGDDRGVRQERVAGGHQAASRERAGRRRRLGRPGRVAVGRAPDELDEQGLEARVDDLEMADRPRPERGRR